MKFIESNRIIVHSTEAHGFIIGSKPAQMPSHSPDHGKSGYVELLAESVGQELHIVHRLDKETSGIMVFANSKESAETFRQLWESHSVTKEYFCITDDQPSLPDSFICTSDIGKTQNTFTQSNFRIETFTGDTEVAKSKTIEQLKAGKAITLFKRVKSGFHFTLWQCHPISGKSHQIRLHAEGAGIPILGDQDHNGRSFPRLCLHAHSLSWHGGPDLPPCPPPKYFNDLSLIADEKILSLWSAYHRRQLLFDLDSLQQCRLDSLRHGQLDSLRHCHLYSLRLYHHEGVEFELDQYGDVLWGYWYPETPPTEKFKQVLSAFATTLNKQLVLRNMQNRGADSQSAVFFINTLSSTQWSAQEESRAFNLHSDRGLSPGLFLDQRENRNWLQRNSHQKSVLNLFAYTGVFSVAAALGGAVEVVTLDLSKNFIQWCKENFELNHLDVSKFEFWSQECMLFCAGANKRNRQFDVIILDPPSFSRSKEGVFRIEKNLSDLLAAVWPLLKKDGILQFTCNYEQWTVDDFKIELQKAAKKLSIAQQLKYEKPLRSGLDFEPINAETLMKGWRIRKV
jgi:23S rRNA (cytosine1962-C5)-methyltransferase